MRNVQDLVVFIITFLVVDAFWIALAALPLYQAEVGHLLKSPPSVFAALVFYVAYAAGALTLVVNPALKSNSFKQAVIQGGVLGCLSYGTYTVTNYAMLNDWSLTLLLTDLIWGAVITSLCCSVTYLFAKSKQARVYN